jgi:heme exporter protein C
VNNQTQNRLALIATILAPIAGIAMMAAIYMVFEYAPIEKVMGMPQKIFYFHVPIAICAYVGFFITFICSIVYLFTKKLWYDKLAMVGAEVGLLFASLMLITGMIWGKPIWGAWWTWDPRLTTSLVLWLIFAGYMILRSRVEEETLRAKYSAVIGIVGYVDVPIVHYSIKLWSRGIHPPKPDLHPMMADTIKVSLVAVFLLFLLILLNRARLEFLKAEVDALDTDRR